jgi:hypothetical protein
MGTLMVVAIATLLIGLIMSVLVLVMLLAFAVVTLIQLGLQELWP